MAVNNVYSEFVKGQKLFITLKDNRNLEGTFCRSSSARKSILLRNVSFVPSNGKSFEQLEFKFLEILLISSREEENQTTNDVNQPVATNDPVVPLKKHNGVLYEKIKEIVSNLIFINQIDEAFSEMVRTVDRVQCIAVTGEGSKEGRFGQLTILGVATNSTVFLVDILNIGPTAFRAAGSFLKRVLESKDMLKVVHNCRMLSDCLKHKYSITLKNVFDTHACHSIIVKNCSGNPASSADFEELVCDYLDLPEGVCNDQVTDPDLWRRRPLEAGLSEAAAWRVALLRKLKPKMEDRFYAPFELLCQQYLNSVRNLDDDLEVRIAMTHQNKPVHETSAFNGAS